MDKEIPAEAYNHVATVYAESEELPLSQRHLREAVTFVEAAVCDHPDCLLIRGHSTAHLPELQQAIEDRETLYNLLGSMAATQSGPLADLASDTLNEIEPRI